MTKIVATKKLTKKPDFAFGSLEHRKYTAKFHYDLIPWVITADRTEADLIVQRVRMADKNKARLAERVGNTYTPRQLAVCELADDSGLGGYGIFFMKHP